MKKNKDAEVLNVLKSVNLYFVKLQTKCALTSTDERCWKKVSNCLNKLKKE